jgi:MYXO-CTERM domain-containing protein
MARVLSRSVRFFSAVAVVLASVTSGQQAEAFPPTNVLTGWGLIGNGHQQITESAIKAVIKRSYGIDQPTRAIKQAMLEIAEWNALVDEDQTLSSLHFDGENFVGGHERIIFRRNGVIEFARLGKASSARMALGQALHTLQDFYAHSNWIELGNSTPNSLLTIPGHTQDELVDAVQEWKEIMAPATMATCKDCSFVEPEPTPFCFDCRDNLVTSRLTSGYYGGEDRKLPTDVKKCSHGGVLDGDGMMGINKDTMLCAVSPHFESHEEAAALGQQATEAFLEGLKSELTDAEFKLLLGVGPSVAIVMDTTESMGEIIEEMRTGVKEMIADRSSTAEQPAQYLLVPLNDPVVGPAKTYSDPTEFMSALDGLAAEGGGDCPEPAMDAIMQAVSSAEDGTTVFVYTNARAKDNELAPAISSLASAKNVKIFPALFGSCSPYDSAFYHLAEETGGQVFVMDPKEAGSITELADATARSDSAPLLTEVRDVAGTEEVVFTTDPTMKKLTISVSNELESPDDLEAGSFVTSVIQGPGGDTLGADTKGAKVVKLRTGAITVVDVPEAGEWKVTLAGDGRARVVVTGESELQLDAFDFVEERGRDGHEGLFPISGAPLAERESLARARLGEDVKSVKVGFYSPSGERLAETAFDPGEARDGNFFGSVVAPSEPFFVRVTGELDDGRTFQRAWSPLFRAQYLSLSAPSFQSALPGTSVKAELSLENVGDDDEFIVTVSDDVGYDLSLSDSRLVLGAGDKGTLELEVEVPDDAKPGTLQAISVNVRSTRDPRLSTFVIVRTEVVAALEEDNDLIPSQSDNCPAVTNTDQADSDEDGRGDACEEDNDGDGVKDASDNCPTKSNRDQLDTDEDGRGDECDPSPSCACEVGRRGSPSWLMVAALAVAGALWRRKRR